MNARQFVETLRARGITVWVYGDRVRLSRKNTLTDEERHILHSYKHDIIAAIRRQREQPES
jgi:hypothetical protein